MHWKEKKKEQEEVEKAIEVELIKSEVIRLAKQGKKSFFGSKYS